MGGGPSQHNSPIDGNGTPAFSPQPELNQPINTDTLLEAAAVQGPGVFQALRVSVEYFQLLYHLTAHEVQGRLKLRHETPEKFSPAEIRALDLLEAISKLTKDAMIAMNKAHPGLPPDTLKTTLDLVTRPGASVVVLHGPPSANLNDLEEVLGYGIVIRGKENFPEWQAKDPEHRIPEVLFEGSDVHHRLIRLFVRDCARDQEAAGKAFDMILEQVKSICDNEPIIGMVLTDLFCQDESQRSTYNNSEWLVAMKALMRRGFEDSGYGLREVIAAPDKPVVLIAFDWYTYPPRSESGLQAYAAQQRRYGDLEALQQARLAGILTSLPVSGARIVHYGPPRDAFALAKGTGNIVFGVVHQGQEAQANRQGRRPNLITIDHTSDPSLLPESPDAIVINGALPDIARGEGAPVAAIERFLREKVETLKPGGLLILRDTIGPSDRAPIYMYLDKEKRFPWSGGRTPAELFEDFVKTAQEPSIDRTDWSQVRRMDDAGKLAQFLVPKNIAAEFILKCRYSASWDSMGEREREYTLQSASHRISMLKSLGLRLIHATPEMNPHVQAQLEQAGLALQTTFGEMLDPFSTNHFSVWHKVETGEGIEIHPGSTQPIQGTPYVSVTRYEELGPDDETVRYHEVANRPGITLDLVPYRIINTLPRDPKLYVGLRDPQLYVWGRAHVPRPVTTLHPIKLDGSIDPGYVDEQLAGIVGRNGQNSSDPAVSMEEIAGVFNRVTGTTLPAQATAEPCATYLVNPNTIDEVVKTIAIRAPAELTLKDTDVSDPSQAFGGKYALTAFNAYQVLQSAQVGHSQSARLERVVYELLLKKRLPCGPWIGPRKELLLQTGGQLAIELTCELLEPPGTRLFRRAADQNARFLRHRRQEFTERNSSGPEHDRHRIFEYIEPDPTTGFSHQSLSLLPILRVKTDADREEILVGLEVRHLPAVFEKTGSSRLLTIPTVRLPTAVRSLGDAYRQATDTLRREFRVSIRELTALGGKYVVSPGITPEVVYPLLAEINLSTSQRDSLTWIPLRELINVAPQLLCAQLITSTYRAGHMLGLLK